MISFSFSPNKSPADPLQGLIDRYLPLAKIPRKTPEELRSFLLNHVDCAEQGENFMGSYFQKMLRRNTFFCIDNYKTQYQSEEFRYWQYTVQNNEKSQSYYQEIKQEEIYVIIEEKTGYIVCNCHTLLSKLLIEKGIDEADLCEKNDICRAYFSYLDICAGETRPV